AADLRQRAEQMRAAVDPKQVEHAASEARQANELIDRRTFSWTEVLNRMETTLPDDVHVLSIRPRIDKGHVIILTISVVARSIDDTDQFMANLETTGAFKKLLSVEDRVNEQGLIESTLQTNYVPGVAKPAAKPATPAPP